MAGLFRSPLFWIVVGVAAYHVYLNKKGVVQGYNPLKPVAE